MLKKYIIFVSILIPNMNKLYAIYFSATDTTRICVDSFCQGLGAEIDESINLADDFNVSYPDITARDIVVVAAPVYGGRLPARVADAFERLKGNAAVAVAIVVYGNRDYDDALLELTDILHRHDFRIVGAGAFIGQHSIFPKVAKSRPDLADKQMLVKFGEECKSAVMNGFYSDNVPYIKGNRPYKKSAGAPLYPKAKEADCVRCGKCVDKCPVGAIPPDTPFITDATKCISCGRCISVCSKGARHHSGFKYSLIGAIFKAAFSKRKEPHWSIAR